MADPVSLEITSDIPAAEESDTTHHLVRVRSMPSLLAFDSDAVHGDDDWDTDAYSISEKRKLDLIARYDPPGTTVDQIRSRYALTRNRTWRAANLRRMKQRKDLTKTQEELDFLAKLPPPGFFDPSRGRYRWILLFFCAFISCAVWFQYDSVGALGDQFRNHTGPGITLDEEQLGILDAVYAIPNCVLVLFGGVIIDKMGLRFALILFMSIVLAGGVLMNVALWVDQFWLMVVSRVVFGIGGESAYVAQDAFTSHWFEGRDLAFALAVTTVVGRMSDIGAFAGLPLIGQRIGVRGAMYVMTGMCVMSLGCTLVCAWMDKRAEKYSYEEEKEVSVREDYSVRSVLKFSLQYWFAAILVMVFYSSILPFQNLCPKFLEANYNIAPEYSGYYTSIISAVSIVVSPILGLTLDRFGYRIYLIQVGLVFMVLAYALFMVPQVTTPVPSLMLLGASFSIIPAALWPCLVILVPSTSFGTAYGIMEAMINIGNTAMYYGISHLLQNDSYFGALLIFMMMSFGGFILSIFWLTQDLKTGNWCNLPTSVQVQPNIDEVPVREKEVAASADDDFGGEDSPLLINDSFARDMDQ